MASSEYRVSVLAFRLDHDKVDSVSIKPYAPHDKVVDSDPKKFDLRKASTKYHDHATLQEYIKKNPDVDVVRIHGVTHSCRETLLEEIRSSIETLNHYESYACYKGQSTLFSNYSVHIEYFEEGGRVLSEERIELILKFSQRFLSRNQGSAFCVQRYKDTIILSYKNTDSIRDYTASLILWLFRNTEIMENCLENIKETSSPKVLFNYLAKNFLRFSSWGNSANPVILLSAFSYFCTMSSVHSSTNNYHSGPASFAQAEIPSNVLSNWIENLVYKEFPDDIGYHDVQLGNCSQNFYSFVNSTMHKLVRIADLTKKYDDSTQKIETLYRKLEKALEKG